MSTDKMRATHAGPLEPNDDHLAMAVHCPGCGYGLPTSDGYCLNCPAPDADDSDDEWDQGCEEDR